MNQVVPDARSVTRVVIVGAGGRMGRQLIAAISENPSYVLVGAIERDSSEFIGVDAGPLAGVAPQGVRVSADLVAALKNADVLIDFTRPEATVSYAAVCAEHRVAVVVGTTGLSETDVAVLYRASEHV